VSGFVLGGVVCGVLGFVFAPQISRALLGEDQRIRLPRFMEEAELDPEVTKQNLAEKIAQLNAAIDDVSAQLRSQESEETTTAA
jgi:gas vesicle protein